MSKIHFGNGVSVNFDGTPTQLDIEEIANKLGINKSEEKQDGILKRFVKTAAKPFAEVGTSALNLGESIYDVARGDTAGANEALNKSRNVPFLGETKPAFTGEENTGQAAQKMVGYGAEIASWYGGGTGAKQVIKQGLSGAIKQGAKTGAKYGAIGGGMTGAAQPLETGQATKGQVLAGAAIGTGLGAAGGALIGGAIPTAVGTIKKAIRPIEEKMADLAIKTSSKIDNYVGKVIQGKTKDIVKSRKALQEIDISDIKSYDDLKNVVKNDIEIIADKQDELLLRNKNKYKIDKLDIVNNVGGKEVRQNYVKEAINNLKELYDVTADPIAKQQIVNLENKMNTEGLTAYEVNNIARRYGSEFGDKAFSKATKEPLTSVNAVRYENIRSGIKNTARSLMPDKATQELDSQITNLYSLQKNTNKMVEAVNQLKQRVEKRKPLEIAGAATGKIADIATFGFLRGFISRMFPSNIGLKTLNSLDLEKALVKNLKMIQKLGVKEVRTLTPITPGTTRTLVEKTKESMRDFVANPKIGLGIEDVSKKPGFSTPAVGKTAEVVSQGERILTPRATPEILRKDTIINLKRDVPITDIQGNKRTIPSGEALTPYELKGNKVLLKDGEEYIVSKNQYQNVKGNAIKAEAKPFASELQGLEETVKGAGKWEGDSYVADGRTIGNLVDNGDGTWSYASDFSEGSEIYKTKNKAKEAMLDELTDPYAETGTKYSSYQLPEGKNYKEILIKAPQEKSVVLSKLPDGYKPERINTISGEEAWSIVNEKGKTVTAKWYPDAKTAAEDYVRGRNVNAPFKDSFKSSHWDEPNVISHLRLNERTYNGKKVTFMEELQSDWAREGRSKGFVGEQKLPTNLERWERDGKFYVKDPEADWSFDGNSYAKAEQKFMANELSNAKFNGAIPNNTLLKNWQELSVKRALKEAADNDSAYFAWINGEQTSARYNLATHLDGVKWEPQISGRKGITLQPKSGEKFGIVTNEKGVISDAIGHTEWEGKKLGEVLGKGLADKIMEKESGTLAGEGLKFGGEWANTLYDKQVGNIVKDLTGAKIETLDMGLPIEAGRPEFKILTRPGGGISRKLEIADLKTGNEIIKGGDKYIITDILGDGKFKAVLKREISDNPKLYNHKIVGEEVKKGDFSRIPESMKETFDISQKLTTQQGIKLTPEIKAKIRGEAPKLKQPSGKEPTFGRTLETKPSPRSL